jgi:glycosyltransferase involved in cell wall biosynthesis
MYALVTPARNDADNLRRLAGTVVRQTLAPHVWVVVDDGSTDDTLAVACELARSRPWVVVLQAGGRGDLRDGRRFGRVLLALTEGIRAVPAEVELVTKLDADVTLPEDYFERLVRAFADPAIGLASGSRLELQDGRWVRRHLTGAAVEAQCRTYRRACWEQIQPLPAHMGWDGIDEASAVLAGWRTRVVDGLDFRHHRPMGIRDGSRVRARSAEGRAAHYMNYRPSYVLMRAIWHARRDPTAFAMLWGWGAAALMRRERYAVPEVRDYVRQKQSPRHLLARASEARRQSEN